MKTTHEKIIIGLGIWLLVLSFTGFPESWKTTLTIITGIVVVYFGALLLKKAHLRASRVAGEKKTETFTETVASE